MDVHGRCLKEGGATAWILRDRNDELACDTRFIVSVSESPSVRSTHTHHSRQSIPFSFSLQGGHVNAEGAGGGFERGGSGHNSGQVLPFDFLKGDIVAKHQSSMRSVFQGETTVRR